MGGEPLLAIAILGWPVDKLPLEVAARVVDGGRAACQAAGITLAGGHSIDAPEPIFGLAVTGRVRLEHLKRNAGATADNLLYLTKPLGVGLLTTAEKSRQLRPEHVGLATASMTRLNDFGAIAARHPAVTAMTDVTGFGLAGHLLELCEGSNVRAELDWPAIPALDGIEHYLDLGTAPGGTFRNFASYGSKLEPISERQKLLLCDPQTSGGLLIAVRAESGPDFEALARSHGLTLTPIGRTHALAPAVGLPSVSTWISVRG